MSFIRRFALLAAALGYTHAASDKGKSGHGDLYTSQIHSDGLLTDHSSLTHGAEANLDRVRSLYREVRGAVTKEAEKAEDICGFGIQTAQNALSALNSNVLIRSAVNLAMSGMKDFWVDAEKNFQECSDCAKKLQKEDDGALLESAEISDIATRLAGDIDDLSEFAKCEATVANLQANNVQALVDSSCTWQPCKLFVQALQRRATQWKSSNADFVKVEEEADSMLQAVRQSFALRSKSDLMRHRKKMPLESVGEDQAMLLESYLYKLKDKVGDIDNALNQATNQTQQSFAYALAHNGTLNVTGQMIATAAVNTLRELRKMDIKWATVRFASPGPK